MTILSIVSALVIGSVVGVVVRLVLHGREAVPVLVAVIVGITAALLGSALAHGLDLATTGSLDWVEIVAQVALAGLGVTLAVRQLGQLAP